jgi:TetR/AcrR family transcriptional regulator
MSVSINIKGKPDKIKCIIDIAQQLFGLYGIEKISMQEIADELKISKASLYYYFPDKESLYKAVIEREHNEFLAKITNEMKNISDPVELLRKYAVLRLSYFRKLLNLSRLRLENFSDFKPVIIETMLRFREREKGIVIGIFNRGIYSGVFAMNDPEKTASLFLDLLKGLRMSIVNSKKLMYIDQEEFDELSGMIVEFIEIFINGIKSK